jgi:hypothetical protein
MQVAHLVPGPGEGGQRVAVGEGEEAEGALQDGRFHDRGDHSRGRLAARQLDDDQGGRQDEDNERQHRPSQDAEDGPDPSALNPKSTQPVSRSSHRTAGAAAAATRRAKPAHNIRDAGGPPQPVSLLPGHGHLARHPPGPGCRTPDRRFPSADTTCPGRPRPGDGARSTGHIRTRSPAARGRGPAASRPARPDEGAARVSIGPLRSMDEEPEMTPEHLVSFRRCTFYRAVQNRGITAPRATGPVLATVEAGGASVRPRADPWPPSTAVSRPSLTRDS